jgi:hypothetical protein
MTSVMAKTLAVQFSLYKVNFDGRLASKLTLGFSIPQASKNPKLV